MRAFYLLGMLSACTSSPSPNEPWGELHACAAAEDWHVVDSLTDVEARALCTTHDAVRLRWLTVTQDLQPDDLGCVCEVVKMHIVSGSRFEGLAHVVVHEVELDRLPNLELVRLGGSPRLISINSVPDDAIVEFPNVREPPRVEMTDASPVHLNGLTALRSFGNVDLSAPRAGSVSIEIRTNKLSIFGAEWGDEHELGCIRPSSLSITSSDVPRFSCDVQVQDLELLNARHPSNLHNVHAQSISANRMPDLVDLSAFASASPQVLSLSSAPQLTSLNGLASTDALDDLRLADLPALRSLPDMPALSGLWMNAVGLQDLGPTWRQTHMRELHIQRSPDLRDLDELASLEEVDDLRLWHVRLDDAHGLDGVARVGALSLAGSLPPVVPHLHSADVITLSDRDDDGMQSWPQIDGLRELHIDNQRAQRSVAGFPAIRTVDQLTLADNLALSDLSGLHGLQRVDRLVFEYNPSLSPEEIEALTEAIDELGEVRVD